MRPVDPRILPHLAPARAALGVTLVGGALGGTLVIGQAFAVAALLVRLIEEPEGPGWRYAALWVAGIAVARALLGGLVDLASARAAGRITISLRHKVLRAAMDLGATRLSQRRTGELGLLATRGVAAVEPYVTRYLPTLVLAAVLPPLTLVTIFWTDPWAGVIVLGTLPLVPVFAILIGLATRDRADRQYRTLALLAGHFLDVVRGLPTLVTFDRARVQSSRIREVTDRYRRATVDTLRLAFASSAALELIATLSVALVAVCVGLRLAAGGIGFETALVVLLLAPEAYWPLRRVGAEFHSAAEGAVTLGAISELLDEAGAPVIQEPGARDGVDPVPIHLADLVVAYPGRTGPALVLPRARIPATGLTAVTGPSGCGKSTLVQVLTGEIAPASGTITLAGAAIDPEQWRTLVAQVPQSPWLTTGSIAENLLIGRPDATDAELWKALAEVGLTEEVAALPDALGTRLGEDGAGLSAGQHARLALARVVLANRPYVVLDEPSAHLDAESEAVLLRTLVRLGQHATVVVVAHRQAVVDAADKVIEVTAPVPCQQPEPSAPGRPGSLKPRPAGPEPAIPTGRVPAYRRLLGTLLAILAAVSGIALTATAGWLIARAAQHPPVLTLMVAIVGVRTFGLARPVLRYAERLVSHDVALRLLAETRARVYDVLVPLAPARLGRHRGDLLTTVVDDVDSVLDHQLRVRAPVQVWLGVSGTVIGFGLLVYPPAALPLAALTLGIGALALAVARLLATRAEPVYVERRAALSEELVADLASARQLVLWQADPAALERTDLLGRQLTAAAESTARALLLGRMLVLVGTGAGTAAMAWTVGSAAGLSGPMQALLLLVPLALSDVLLALPEAGVMAARTAAARARIADLSATEPAVHEPHTPASLVVAAPDIRLQNVSVGWTRPVLTGLELDLSAGTTLGVVGPSGCGKSTLAALLVRHLQPLHGRYLLAGRDTADLASAEVRRQVGLVDDNPYVFASSLRENLRLAAPLASDEQLVTTLDTAGLAVWFDTLPHGLDTLLGAGASAVSGGERARLGIARALLADPGVLVLDEPTAHLDPATARAVTATVRSAWRARSLVWITHDHASLDGLDRVLDLDPARRLRFTPEAR